MRLTRRTDFFKAVDFSARELYNDKNDNKNGMVSIATAGHLSLRLKTRFTERTKMKNFKIIKKLSAAILAILLLATLSACNLKETFCIHDFAETTVAASCKDEGTVTDTCRKCGYVTTKTLSKTAHTYDSGWTETVAATCLKSGKAERVCSVCGFKDELIIAKKDHVIKSGETFKPTCTEKGYTLGVCENCGETEKGNYVAALGHDFGDWIEITPASAAQNGTMERECKRCHEKETRTIVFYGHIDNSALTYNFNAGETPAVTSESELQAFYKAALFNRAETATCNISGFMVTESVISNLKNIKFDFDGVRSTEYSYKNGSLTISATYSDLPAKTTTAAARQTQYASANYYKAETPRNGSYDGFEINASAKTYPVTYTDQLYYVLERGYKPLPVSGSPAERVYAKIKAALREIISDDMTDFEKVRAIHDYLVMNVVYDNALYDLAFTSTNLKSYNGFYLEGVFDDKIAVCDGISKAFSAMANIEGIPCVRVTGKTAGTTGNVGHAWNKVLIDENWYVVDATSDNVIVNGEYEILSLEYFLVTDEKMGESYVADGYAELNASTDYSKRYTDNSFSVLLLKYDFVVDSDAELKALIRRARNASSSGGTVQFTTGSGYTANIGSKISDFYSECGLSSARGISCGGDGVYTYSFV